jgi:hypothetical protein
MVIVALAAVLFGWVAAERRKRVAALAAELRQRQDRVEWAERMYRRGYVSRAALAADQKQLEETRSQIDRLGALPKRP